MLKLYAAELKAEQAFMDSDCAGAETLQALLDSGAAEAEDSGWYLQERTRYLYRAQRRASQNLQAAANKPKAAWEACLEADVFGSDPDLQAGLGVNEVDLVTGYCTVGVTSVAGFRWTR